MQISVLLLSKIVLKRQKDNKARKKQENVTYFIENKISN